jgi:hypothetical protein
VGEYVAADLFSQEKRPRGSLELPRGRFSFRLTSVVSR